MVACGLGTINGRFLRTPGICRLAARGPPPRPEPLPRHNRGGHKPGRFPKQLRYRHFWDAGRGYLRFVDDCRSPLDCDVRLVFLAELTAHVEDPKAGVVIGPVDRTFGDARRLPRAGNVEGLSSVRAELSRCALPLKPQLGEQPIDQPTLRELLAEQTDRRVGPAPRVPPKAQRSREKSSDRTRPVQTSAAERAVRSPWHSSMRFYWRPRMSIRFNRFILCL
jgi:hypothetical protein